MMSHEDSTNKQDSRVVSYFVVVLQEQDIKNCQKFYNKFVSNMAQISYCTSHLNENRYSDVTCIENTSVFSCWMYRYVHV